MVLGSKEFSFFIQRKNQIMRRINQTIKEISNEKTRNNKVKSDLPIQSGKSVPARDSEYLLPVNKAEQEKDLLIINSSRSDSLMHGFVFMCHVLFALDILICV